MVCPGNVPARRPTRGVPPRWRTVWASIGVAAGSSRLDLPATGPGTFEASGGNLALDGIWQVTAVVGGSAAAVEVPFVLATRVPAEAVTSDPSTEASGVLMPRPNTAAFEVYDTWSLSGHKYRLILLAYPKQGPAGTLAAGRTIARQILKAVVYATPA